MFPVRLGRFPYDLRNARTEITVTRECLHQYIAQHSRSGCLYAHYSACVATRILTGVVGMKEVNDATLLRVLCRDRDEHIQYVEEKKGWKYNKREVNTNCNGWFIVCERAEISLFSTTIVYFLLQNQTSKNQGYSIYLYFQMKL